MSSTVEIIVRGYHVDIFQHVNNARYLEFLEEGRWNFLTTPELFEYLESRNMGFVVVNININYRHGAKINDVLVVETKSDRFTERAGVLKQVIHLKGTDIVVADAEITYVLADMVKNKSVPITDELKALLANSDGDQ